MERDVLRRVAVRYVLLFLVSVLLVAGFWFHGSFYELGLVPLLLVGGLATFLVLLVVRASTSGRIGRRRPAGDVIVGRDAAAAVASGGASLLFLPIDARVPRPGSVANVRASPSAPPVARVQVRDLRRRLVADISEAEARAAGHPEAGSLRRELAGGRPARPGRIVLVLEVRREDPA